MPSNEKKLKAFILAAGYGTRLRPLTNQCPKALLPFMNQPILFHILDQIKQTGIKEVCINAHYRGEMIQEAVKHYKSDLNITVSLESEILGTGGALAAASCWRNSADLLVINADIIHSFNLSEIILRHYEESPYATLALTRTPHPKKTVIWCSNKKISSFEKKTSDEQSAHSFACVHLISNRLLNQLPTKKNYCIIPIYKSLLLKKKYIQAYISSNFWLDVGTPEEYLQCHLDFFNLMKKGLTLDHPAFSDISSSLKGFDKTISTTLSKTHEKSLPNIELKAENRRQTV